MEPPVARVATNNTVATILPKSVELTPTFLQTLKRPFTLIVPDGNWRQASKMGRRIVGLKNVPQIKLPVGAPTQYFLRRAPQEHCLSTIEAIARALGIIEGPPVQEALEKLFRLMVKNTIGTRSPDTLRSLNLA